MDNLTGPTTLCKGACNVRYSINLLGGGACAPVWQWTLDGVEFSDNFNKNVLLDFPDEGDFTLCVTAIIGNPQSGSICDQEGPKCIIIKVRQNKDRKDGPRYICSENVPFSWQGKIIDATGEYTAHFIDKTCCEYDSIVYFNVLPEVEIPMVYFLGCKGDSYRDRTTGKIFNTCQDNTKIELKRSTNPYKCDSAYYLTTVFIDLEGNITNYCQDGKIIYEVIPKDLTCQANGFYHDSLSYKWYRRCDTSKNILSNSQILEVTSRDVYCVDITTIGKLDKLQKSCTFQICEQTEESLPQYIDNCTDYPAAQGRVFWDSNNDQIYTPGEKLISDAIIRTDPESFVAISDTTGFTIQLTPQVINLIYASSYNPKYYTVSPSIFSWTQGNSTGIQPGIIDFAVRKRQMTDLDIRIAGTQIIPGSRGRYYLTLRNEGNTAVSGVTINLEIPSDWIIESSSPSASIINKQLVQWNVQSSMGPNEKQIFIITLNVPPTAIPNTSFELKASLAPTGDADPENDVFIWKDRIQSESQQIRKLVDKERISWITQGSDELCYTLQFQNTDSSTSKVIHIIDSLSNQIDPLSIRIIHASHPYTFKFINAYKLFFVFENIDLISKNSDFLASQGIIQFTTRTKTNLQSNSIIENFAFMHNNCNNPTISNIVKTQLVTLNSKTSNSTVIGIKPNPFDQYFDVTIANHLEPFKLLVMDIHGKIVYEQSVTLNQSSIRINSINWTKGVYQLVMNQPHNIILLGKLVKF
ncbi:MAG: T9SS type A sorting domain-containing protein [Saprospiraceae bacterium]|nr:T9SS type A sorting domain-containing protein [Saprospiraceae bacterium]